jgi:hypothetical protein
MELDKEILRQFIFVVAVNAGMMSGELAEKIKNYDPDTFRKILLKRARDLRAKAARPEYEFFDSEYYENSAKIIDTVLSNLELIFLA